MDRRPVFGTGFGPDSSADLDMVRKAVLNCAPPGTVLAIGTDKPPAGFGLHADEAQALARARGKRRRQFAAGRACAHRALADMGRPQQAIPVGMRGAPQWPPGVVGSISHCDGLAAALLGRSRQYQALGLDVEIVQPLSRAAQALVLTPTEQAHARNDRVVIQHFCAKEALYKCLASQGGSGLEFLDVSLRQDGDTWVVTGTNTATNRLLTSTAPQLRLTHGEHWVAAVAWCQA